MFEIEIILSFILEKVVQDKTFPIGVIVLPRLDLNYKCLRNCLTHGVSNYPQLCLLQKQKYINVPVYSEWEKLSTL